MKILIADSERDHLDVAGYALVKRGHDVYLADTTEDAMRHLQHEPHYIFIDIHLRGSSSIWEILRIISSDYPQAELLVTFASIDDSDQRHLDKLGIDSYAYKTDTMYHFKMKGLY